MPRVKRGKSHVKRRKKLLAKVKGYRWGRKNLIKAAKVAATKAGAHAYADRRRKKRTARSLWQIKINAFVREHGLSYSRFMNLAKKKGIIIDRKILSDLSANHKDIMLKLLEEIKK